MLYKRIIPILISTLIVISNLILTKTVTVAEQDITPPIFKSINVDKIIVTGGESIKVAVDATDDISGLKGGYLHYDSPSKGQSKSGYFQLVNGKYETTIDIGTNDESGIWTANLIQMNDNAGNYILLERSTIFASGDFEVNIIEKSKDINNDGVIDIRDLAEIAKLYNHQHLDTDWNPIYDINIDNNIDIYDLVLVSKAIGQQISNEFGNLYGNIVNQGIAASDDSCVYYMNDLDGKKLYKIGKDVNSKMKISDDMPLYINAYKGWIYYQNVSDGNILYRIRTDGSERTKLNDVYSTHIYIANDSIYYIGGYPDTNSRNIYKMNLDGSNNIKLSSDNYFSSMTISDSYIYYEQYGSLYKMNINGSNTSKVCEDSVAYINVIDNWIYYRNWSDSGYIYKIRTDGTNKIRLNNKNSNYINVVDNYIYYIANSDKYPASPYATNRIFRMKIDGTDNIMLNDIMCESINIIDEWIYFRNKYDFKPLYRMYKMKLDGSNNILVN